MRRPLLACVLGTALALAPSCGRSELSGPPTIRLGSDQCAGCGMIVSEERCSCAILVEIDGTREHLVFDDLGCLLDYRTNHPQTIVIDTFVRDYGTTNWIGAPTAQYLAKVSDTLTTPMGSGIVAFVSRERAEGQQAVSGGEIVPYNQLAATRLAWHQIERPPSNGAP